MLIISNYAVRSVIQGLTGPRAGLHGNTQHFIARTFSKPLQLVLLAHAGLIVRGNLAIDDRALSHLNPPGKTTM